MKINPCKCGNDQVRFEHYGNADQTKFYHSISCYDCEKEIRVIAPEDVMHTCPWCKCYDRSKIIKKWNKMNEP